MKKKKGAIRLRATQFGPRVCAVLLSAVLVGLGIGQPGPATAAAHRQLLLVLDGLRPDYVTPSLMPALYALGRRGVVFENHHSVFPTVTRVNASSISTGAYPEVHGLLGNSVFFPQADKTRFLNTDDRATLQKIDAAVQGKLLTAPTLGETLQAAGKKLLVVSAGSSGSAFLLNHKVAGGAILHTDFAMPESFQAKVDAQLGGAISQPTSDGKDRRAVDIFLEVGLREVDPAVTIMWLTDPDTTAHEKGIGTPETVEALKALDAEVGRLLDGLSRKGVLDDFDVWVTSDHGFSTNIGGPNLEPVLKPAAGTLPDGAPRLVSGGGAIYIRDHDRPTIARMVADLQRTPGVGAIFTPAAQPGSLDGRVTGTLSFDAARWQHERSADILYAPDWTDRKNTYGYPGTTASGGVAGHGNSSPFDIHNTLIAAGPDLKRGVVLRAPSGNVDFAPTLLRLLGIGAPPSMQGRVLGEALLGGADSSGAAVRSLKHSVRTGDNSYVLDALFSVIESEGKSFRYLDRTEVTRASR